MVDWFKVIATFLRNSVTGDPLPLTAPSTAAAEVHRTEGSNHGTERGRAVNLGKLHLEQYSQLVLPQHGDRFRQY